MDHRPANASQARHLISLSRLILLSFSASLYSSPTYSLAIGMNEHGRSETFQTWQKMG